MSATEFWRDLKPIEKVFRKDELCHEHYEKVGIGAASIDKLFR